MGNFLRRVRKANTFTSRDIKLGEYKSASYVFLVAVAICAVVELCLAAYAFSLIKKGLDITEGLQKGMVFVGSCAGVFGALGVLALAIMIGYYSLINEEKFNKIIVNGEFNKLIYEVESEVLSLEKEIGGIVRNEVVSRFRNDIRELRKVLREFSVKEEKSEELFKFLIDFKGFVENFRKECKNLSKSEIVDTVRFEQYFDYHGHARYINIPTKELVYSLYSDGLSKAESRVGFEDRIKDFTKDIESAKGIEEEMGNKYLKSGYKKCNDIELLNIDGEDIEKKVDKKVNLDNIFSRYNSK
jgi:hypothetical protein